MGLEHERRAHDIKKRIADALPQKLAETWESRVRERTLDKGGFTPLNEMLSFNVDPDFPDEAALHIHENLTKTPIEANRLMLEGLHMLAERLREDPQLAHLTKVSGYSWIVYNSPDILRKLGFRVSGFNHAKKTALATMDRDTFIRRFARQKAM